MTPFRKVTLVLAGLVLASVAAFLISSASRDDSDLKVGRITAQEPVYPSGSIPYSLPLKSIVITTSTKVTGCSPTEKGEEIHGQTSMTVTDLVEIDPQQMYLYYDSEARGKDLNYGLENYENGTLKSISASIHDQVAPITAAVVGALLKLVPPFPAAAPPSPPPAPPPPPNCHDLQAAIANNKNDARLIIHQEDIWTPSEYYLSFYVDPNLSPLTREFRLSSPHWFRVNAMLQIRGSYSTGSSDINFIRGKCSDRACQSSVPSLATGLVLRNAVIVQLLQYVCDISCDSFSNIRPRYESDVEGLTQYPTVEKVLPQFGKLFLFPVHSGYAQDSSLDLAMTADGLITKLQLQTKSSLAANVAEIGNNAGGVTSAVASAETATDKGEQKSW